MEKLRECPFCGGEAELQVLTHSKLRLYCFVQCTKCICGTLDTYTAEEAIKAWNTRHEPPTPHGAIVPAGNERLKHDND